ncbi:unnamed protein product [Aphanomyces euteiches]|uniref:Uncharacterized protein n=1 Tax=Aphanomyces euteiches TaxID=100861 RepID=A0A6G0W6U0_9STRA|nr:hypothetical protein Ae201684_018900 [Aphanomyces euteiches]KAH9089693.1 hypothetical protein Ae201684P_007859 [Aphanomyces euteiches]KAH9141070.1 hypothetical protein AeRB84_014731 [Aphanomyces euteiches]
MIASSRKTDNPLSLTDDRAICIFTATENPSVLAKLHLFPHEHTTLVVHFSRGIVSLRRNHKVVNVDACQIVIEPRGENQVVFQHTFDDSSNLIFSSELEAVTFVGAIHLVRHLAAQRDPEENSQDSDTTMLSKFTKHSLEYAEELWSLILWQRSYEFYSIVATLNGIVAEAESSTVNAESIGTKLSDLFQRFESEATLDETVELDGSTHFTLTPVDVLLLQILALQEHANCIMT